MRTSSPGSALESFQASSLALSRVPSISKRTQWVGFFKLKYLARPRLNLFSKQQHRRNGRPQGTSARCPPKRGDCREAIAIYQYEDGFLESVELHPQTLSRFLPGRYSKAAWRACDAGSTGLRIP